MDTEDGYIFSPPSGFDLVDDFQKSNQRKFHYEAILYYGYGRSQKKFHLKKENPF